ncbi:hypothetical protein A3A14_03295 [Candidatus Daviesbacteria bacterium RIFCSPLOWO2_01_FULL_43_38]|uniref:AI-2E family transporter n=2 Tax=Candidatus Daviesiibacteriota TaxID=1752718 RepID=A0A1F5K751_9BACT|nr:MAG: hypothetical protein UV41_C0005G0006 [Candidatus Daviesbacteria bacterium GW2011_GWA2_42_7]OGE20608.1 MAG: hypothetical protein A2874_01920 [Candidatus Daviesbacteria bacterium RIFCSPHIGHO2_01_FULL_43_17]OGE36752.1 MAG: hypothetical protein A3E45_01340 [Candidatus Daviesbacteria bacterium RIFCSPHIGHO2_12_FULL_43_11]OGE63670.1 MAG: hypothetical protein A3A14_03295 [Candidatus Daviesbacteria bacterium RIFCSPLOWO2_01_FULL_43_38]
MTRRVDISYKTIIFITVFLISLWVLFLIMDVILLLLISFILMSAFAPLVDRLVKWRVPKPAAIGLIFVLFIGGVAGILTVGLTPLINETSNLVRSLTESLSVFLQVNLVDQSVIQNELSKFSGQIIDLTLNLFDFILRFVTVLVITFYLLLDREHIEERVAALFVSHRGRAEKLIKDIESKLGAWLRGQMILSVVIAVSVYIGLTIIGLDYALPLAIIAGLLEIIPIIGPIIAAAPAVLIAFTTSVPLAVIVGIMYAVIQQLESNIVVPQLMKRAVGLNPLLIIIAITVGGRLLGVGGALLAVPIAVVIQVVAQEILSPAQTSG